MAKFRIARKALESAVHRVAKVADTSAGARMEFRHLLARATADGLTLTAGDGVQFATSTTGLEDTIPGDFCVSIEDLLIALQGVRDDVVEINSTATHGAHLRAGRRDFDVPGIDPTTYLVSAVPTLRLVQLPVAALRKVLDRTAYAVPGPSASEHHPRVLLLEGLGARIRTVATDGSRIALAEEMVDGLPVMFRVQLHARVLAEVRYLLGLDEVDVIALGDDGRAIVLVAAGTTIVSRQLVAQFPNYSSAATVESERAGTVVAVDIVDALRTVQRMAHERTTAVRLDVRRNRIVVANALPEHGAARVEVDAEMDGPPLTIHASAPFLIDAVEGIGDDRVRLEFGDANSPIIVRPAEGGAAWGLVQPMHFKS